MGDFATDAPLVSIGLPTYNRADLLRNALEHVLGQSHAHVEIIVSDNASPDPAVQGIVQEFVAKDGRVRAFRQSIGLPPFENFIFVLQQARGEYFMWAADDDYFEPWFIAHCLRELQARPNAVLVCTEARYFSDSERFDFLPEGAAFRGKSEGPVAGRVEHLLRNNYGNLLYGLFRRSALVRDEEALWSKTALTSLNEISLLLLVAEAGDIIVLPEIGLHKNAPRPVYEQVVWEIRGGWHPKGPTLHPKSVMETARYHLRAAKDVESAIALTSLPAKEKQHLRFVARTVLLRHFLQLISGRKPVATGAVSS